MNTAHRLVAACAVAYATLLAQATDYPREMPEAATAAPTQREPSSMRILPRRVAASDPQPVAGYSWRELLDALREVETGGQPRGGLGAVGDGGAALGPLQIHKVYHVDAADRDPALTSYASCSSSQDYSERVVRAYMSRYASAQLQRLEAGSGTLADCEVVARIHNGGPRGHQRAATAGYWQRTRRILGE